MYSVTLGEKQEEFSMCLAQLITWMYEQGWGVRIGEVHRTRAQAALNAKSGKGIKNSVHCLKLAADLFVSIDGQVSWDFEDYAAAGERWKSLSDFSRWGGDFKNRDAVHFSFEHRGVC